MPMKEIYILKIGGSIITQKSSEKLILNRKKISLLAKALKNWLLKNTDKQLILIHGAGGPGHHIAHKYNLVNGANFQKNGWEGSVKSRRTNQLLNSEIFKILHNNKLSVLPIHTSSIIIQNNKLLNNLYLEPINQCLKNNSIPLLYGDMVFDEKLGMSICSGDTIASKLSTLLNIKKVFFATDVDGIYTKDPHKYPDTTLIQEINIKDIYKNNLKLSSSHNTDVSGGLRGKVTTFCNLAENSPLQEVIIFNGNNTQNYYEALSNSKLIKKTSIKIKNEA